MSRLIIHFGMHKTGSSSIQEFLFRHLADPRFRYIDLGAANSSGKIATAFMEEPHTYHAHQKRGRSMQEVSWLRDQTIARLRAELERARGRTAILSGEFVPYLRDQELAALSDFVSSFGYSVHAVGYVRAPKAYMQSAFQQRVKEGKDVLNPWGLYPDYRERFHRLEDVFGKDHVRFWYFDPKSFPSGCVVQDFCRRLGIEFSGENVVRVNDALSLPALSLLYTYRRFGPGYGVGPTAVRENNRLIERLRALPGAKLRFHSSLVAPVINANRADLAWMETRLGVPLVEDLVIDDEHAVRSEDDLLTCSPETLNWLGRQLGAEPEKHWHPRMTPNEVASRMHKLRRKIVEERAFRSARVRRGVEQGGVEMNVNELVGKVREAAPDSLEDVPDAKAVGLLRAAFEQIAVELESIDEGRVVIGSLGQFYVKQVERNREGAAKLIKRIVFRPAQPRDGA